MASWSEGGSSEVGKIAGANISQTGIDTSAPTWHDELSATLRQNGLQRDVVVIKGERRKTSEVQVHSRPRPHVKFPCVGMVSDVRVASVVIRTERTCL